MDGESANTGLRYGVCGQGLKIECKEVTIDYQSSETILEAMERSDIDAQFNCREGFCGVCRTKLLAGEVEYTLDPLAFIDDDEILTCCTKPIGNIVVDT